MAQDLTRDADRLLCTLYKVYLERRKNGTSKNDAMLFGDSEDIHQSYFPALVFDDIDNACWELKTAGYVTCEPGDDIANDVILTNSAIIRMENRFKNGIKEVLTFLSNFVP